MRPAKDIQDTIGYTKRALRCALLLGALTACLPLLRAQQVLPTPVEGSCVADASPTSLSFSASGGEQVVYVLSLPVPGRSLSSG